MLLQVPSLVVPPLMGGLARQKSKSRFNLYKHVNLVVLVLSVLIKVWRVLVAIQL